MSLTVATSRLLGQIRPISEVDDHDRNQMFSLMTRFYENVNRETFDSDFDSKTWVIVARCPTSGTILGFSTQWFGEFVVDGNRVGILYSGDTVVDSRYWTKNPLATLWGRLALQLIDRYPDRELYWFLISKGYKTYRFLPVFFERFYPRPGQTMPQRHRHIIDHVSRAKFGSRYLSSRGIVKADDNGCRLRNEVAAVTEQRLRDPFIKFFDTINPGHVDGDELCCLASLSRDNFNQSAYRVISMSVDRQDSRSARDIGRSNH